MLIIKRSDIRSLYCPAISCLFSPKIQFQFRCFAAESKPQQRSPSLVESSTGRISTEQESFTVDYLIKSCGLSPESAVSASKRLKLRSPERADSVLALLRDNGFSKTQIVSIIKSRPILIQFSSHDTLLPKLRFFQSMGLSSSSLARLISGNPNILCQSLNNHIIPFFNYLNSILLSNERSIAALKRNAWILRQDYSKNIEPNIAFLLDVGVSHKCLSLMLVHLSEALMLKQTEFCRVLREVEEMGFDPKKYTFVLAVFAISGSRRWRWERSFEAYGRWGLSKDDILAAFRKHPSCMLFSEEKLMKSMDFLVNKMGWTSQDVVQSPVVLFYSLEKRIIPRCMVIRALLSKGLLLKEKLSLTSVLVPPEKYFLQRFVIKYEEDIPELLSVYKGKVDFEES